MGDEKIIMGEFGWKVQEPAERQPCGRHAFMLAFTRSRPTRPWKALVCKHSPDEALSIPLSRITKGLRFQSTETIAVYHPQFQDCSQKTRDSRARDKRLWVPTHFMFASVLPVSRAPRSRSRAHSPIMPLQSHDTKLRAVPASRGILSKGPISTSARRMI